jgi:hypothetical protein
MSPKLPIGVATIYKLPEFTVVSVINDHFC